MIIKMYKGGKPNVEANLNERNGEADMGEKTKPCGQDDK